MERRSVLKLGLGATMGWATNARAATKAPVIDAHIHLFDTRRPGGVPWPEKTDSIYQPALPDRYAQIAEPFGIVGAIAVEASPLRSDNDWVLQLIAQNPVIVGFVGDLVPGSSSFAGDLETLHANPLFLGIRCGNLWNRDLSADVENRAFVDDLRRLASAGLEMDSANPDAKLIAAILRASEQVPELRIVIDHLPHAVLPEAPGELQDYWAHLKSLSGNPHVFVKLSEIPVKVDGRVPTATSYYREKLDALWELFGEDRILFGSDWPNSDHIASYAETFGIVRDYVSAKGSTAKEKFFYKNSIAAYRWRSRLPTQQL
ncbi:MAG: amidohydrolase family protein [Terracidiphilus sp.]